MPILDEWSSSGMQFQLDGSFNDIVEMWLAIIIPGPSICRQSWWKVKGDCWGGVCSLWTRGSRWKGGSFAVLLLNCGRHFKGYLSSLCVMPPNFGSKKGQFIHFYLLYWKISGVYVLSFHVIFPRYPKYFGIRIATILVFPFFYNGLPHHLSKPTEQNRKEQRTEQRTEQNRTK